MFMYKIIHGYVDLNFSNFFSVCHSGYNLRRHGFTIQLLRRLCKEHLNNFFTHELGTNYLRVLLLLLLLLPSRITSKV